MSDLNQVFRRLHSLAFRDEKTLYEFLAKLFEEAGEVAEAVLSATGAPGCGYKNKTEKDILEEGCDVIIVASALLFSRGMTTKDLIETLHMKMDKWEEKLGPVKTD